MKKLVFGIIATVVFGFVRNAQNLRDEFLKDKTYDQIILKFNEINNEQRAALWIEKLDQLLKEELPSEHKELILVLKEDLEKNGYNTLSERSKEAAIRLANITPDKDFEEMFESLFDYKYNGKFRGCNKVSEEIIADISNISPPSNTESSAKVPCSCRWCVGIDHTYTNCVKSSWGCGWFFMQECTKSISGL